MKKKIRKKKCSDCKMLLPLDDFCKDKGCENTCQECDDFASSSYGAN